MAEGPAERAPHPDELPAGEMDPALAVRPAVAWSEQARRLVRRAFGPERADRPTHLHARWIWLRLLGGIFFSAFYSLAFQIRGLIGPRGILPAVEYLHAMHRYDPGLRRFWAVPSLLWLGSGDGALRALVIAGLIASVLLVFNVWPRATIAVCALLFLSFVSAARAFADYQSDGMLMEAAFLSLFFAPRGLRPGLGAAFRPSWAARTMLLWEWFRIYFESGVVKLASGDPEWAHLTALVHYYQNGPLPTWIGWWMHQLPRGFHVATAAVVLLIELVLVWTAWLPRPFKIACFLLVTPMQALIILTANYCFLNYLVLSLGFLLLDDRMVEWAYRRVTRGRELRIPLAERQRSGRLLRRLGDWRLLVTALPLSVCFYVTVVESPLVVRQVPQWMLEPAIDLAPLRVANRYGLFAVMTEPRYEIELQGSNDGVHWTAYPFRYKPQALDEAPGIYAPYQPRFDWNLWFASVAHGDGELPRWRADPWVLTLEERLLQGSEPVLALFRRDPFAGHPPREVRAVVSLYSFTDRATRRATGRWWNRTDMGVYAPVLERGASGTITAIAGPSP